MLDGISSAGVGGGRAGGRAGWVRESERAEEADRSTTGGPFLSPDHFDTSQDKAIESR